jgi:hypothetical protein
VARAFDLAGIAAQMCVAFTLFAPNGPSQEVFIVSPNKD